MPFVLQDLLIPNLETLRKANRLTFRVPNFNRINFWPGRCVVTIANSLAKGLVELYKDTTEYDKFVQYAAETLPKLGCVVYKSILTRKGRGMSSTSNTENLLLWLTSAWENTTK
jgi:hypothetical protein